jgi:hypothetical protein
MGGHLTAREVCVCFILGNMTGTRHSILGLRAVLSAAAAIACAGRLRADLAPTSPFIPANSAGAAAQAGPSGPIELRGVMATSEGVAYCIYDTAKKRDVWVGLNEAGHDFVVRSSDPALDSVRVDYQGRTLNLTLRTAKVASAGSGQQAAPPQLASQVAINPTPAEEQRRLDAVSLEVRRRRLEREKSAQESQSGQGPGGQPPSPNR